jgi:hypothetical protein
MTRPALRSLLAALCLAAPWPGLAHASPDCRMPWEDDALGELLIVQRVPTSAGRLLAPPGSELFALGQPDGPALPVRCGEAGCELQGDPPPPPGSLVLVRGASGAPLLVMRAGPGRIERARAAALARAGAGLTYQVVPRGNNIPLAARRERASVGALHSVAGGARLDPASLHAMGPPSDDELTLVLATEPTPPASPSAPPPPPLVAREVAGSGSCDRHGALLFTTTAQPAWLAWSITDATSGRPLTPPEIGTAAHAEAFSDAARHPGPLAIGGSYALEARAIDAAGRLSAPTRVPFTLRETGGARDLSVVFRPALAAGGAVVDFLEQPAFAVPALALLIAGVAAWNSRRRARGRASRVDGAGTGR